MELTEQDKQDLAELEAFEAADRAAQGSGPMQPCPICGNEVPKSERYPRYLCGACESRAVNEEGQPVEFNNVSAGAGFVAINKTTGERTEDHVCFVDGKKCWAAERYMGGVVVQLFEDRGV